MPTSSNTRRGFGTFGRTRSSAWNKTNRRSSSRGGRSTGSTGTGYRQLQNTLQQKINSFRVLYTQTQGAGGSNRPAPGTLSSFANWINKGAVIHTVSPSQVSRWSNTGRPCNSPAVAKTVLCQRFGRSPIKAVCKSKTGSFIVATAPTFKGRSFKFPNY